MGVSSGEEQLIIEGLGGKRALSGSVAVDGSKNAGLPVIAASLMCDAPVTYTNVPEIEDMERMFELLADLGVRVDRSGEKVTIDTSGPMSSTLTPEVSKRFRASVILTGPLLARMGEVRFPHPGGCVIGERPIDIFIRGFEALGATVSVEDDMYVVRGKELTGGEYFMKVPSVTGTESLVLAALGATGTTTIFNASHEPEVVALCDFLTACGVSLHGVGTSTLSIDGLEGERIATPSPTCAIIPDRLEAGSYLIVGALAATELTVTNCNPDHLRALFDVFDRVGVSYDIHDDSVMVRGGWMSKDPVHMTIKTHEYPGFPTDLQAPLAVLLTQVVGETLLFETIFEGRLAYLHDLERMGAKVDHWDSHRATIHGPTALKGRHLRSPDIRAGLAFVIAAIIAEGESVIDNVYLIDRGYARVEQKLRSIGARIERRVI